MEDSAEVRRLQVENERLVAELQTERRRSEHDRREMAERMRGEVERRMYEEREAERARSESMQSELTRLRVEVERLTEEKRRVQIEVEESRTRKKSSSVGLDLADILPSHLELHSLRRSDWRRLFERLVAELRRRRDEAKADERLYDSKRYTTDYDVRSHVDRLWDQASRDMRHRPPALPPVSYPKRDASDFLSWTGYVPPR